MNRYAALTAARVKGSPIETNFPKMTGYPSFFRIPQATILADAPIGVIFPPRLAPISRPKRNNEGSICALCAIPDATGSIATRKGTLSINAERITEIKTIAV